MPNVMAALPNIVAPSVQRRKVWLTPNTKVPCSNATKTRNPLKFAGVPQTGKPISAAIGPKFTILSRHVEEVLLFTIFFRLSIRVLVAKIWPEEVMRWCRDSDFFRLFSAIRAQRVSDLHPKFALRVHHAWMYGRHPICDG